MIRFILRIRFNMGFNMNFKNLLLISALFFSTATAYSQNMSNDESAGQCIGLMIIGTNQYKLPAKDWDAAPKKVFTKHYPTFQKINPLMQECMQGDNNKMRACLSKLPTKADRDFYTGINDGIGAADNAFSKGGLSLLKMTGGITCSGIN